MGAVLKRCSLVHLVTGVMVPEYMAPKYYFRVSPSLGDWSTEGHLILDTVSQLYSRMATAIHKREEKLISYRARVNDRNARDDHFFRCDPTASR